MTAVERGVLLAAEIASQPERWRAMLASDAPARLRDALRAPVLCIGSGSSFHVAELTARMLRRAGTAAFALAATDDDVPPFVPASVVAFSQSGRSADVLAAVARFAAPLIALTNDARSPLADRAAVVVDVAAGPERAVPATKSVTTTIACVLAALGDAAGVRASAERIEAWLTDTAVAQLGAVAPVLLDATSIIVAGSGDGAVLAREAALKLKEAAYRRAEGVAAGEFRHGGIALFDPTCALVLLLAGDPAQAKLVAAAERAGTPVVTLGPGGVLDPGDSGALATLVCVQSLALALGRRAGVESDTPRGISKVVGQ
jgi:glucosamine--fructose-6-phosphate aminotransferase (isomerizing)